MTSQRTEIRMYVVTMLKALSKAIIAVLIFIRNLIYHDLQEGE